MYVLNYLNDKIQTGYVKEMFMAVDSVCKLPESELKNQILKELTVAISYCNKPIMFK